MKTIHEQFQSLAQQIYTETGVRVNELTIDWLDVSSVSRESAIVTNVRIQSDRRSSWSGGAGQKSSD